MLPWPQAAYQDGVPQPCCSTPPLPSSHHWKSQCACQRAPWQGAPGLVLTLLAGLPAHDCRCSVLTCALHTLP